MLHRIRDFMLISSKLTYPGFARALGIDPQRVLHHHMDKLSYDEQKKEFSFSYEIPKHATKGGRLPLSGFLSVFDDVTTWAIVALDRKKRAGVSTSLFAELGPLGLQGGSMGPGDLVQINARVVKIGKVFAFAAAEAVEFKTGRVICYGRHTKYMPMGIFYEILLGPLLPVTKLITKWLPDKYPLLNPSTDDLLEFKEFTKDHSLGTFHVENDHNNPMGSCHGGCQAMGMEIIGQGYAETSLKGKALQLRSINVSYMSTAKKEIDFVADWIHVTDSSASMTVKVNSAGGNPVAEGILHFGLDSKNKEE